MGSVGLTAGQVGLAYSFTSSTYVTGVVEIKMKVSLKMGVVQPACWLELQQL